MVFDLQINETNTNRTHGEEPIHLYDEENLKEPEAKARERDGQIATGTEKVREEIKIKKPHPHL